MREDKLWALLRQVRSCQACAVHLPHGPRPVVQAGEHARLLIVGQAPGRRVHETGIPWNDSSGDRLREWLQLPREAFYDPQRVAIMPLAFCYPGKGKSGDLPPRRECASLWHARLRDAMPAVRLTLLIGRYAQEFYLRDNGKRTLTETVATYEEYLPAYFPLPHPSPRNQSWWRSKPWFANDVLPVLRKRIESVLT